MSPLFRNSVFVRWAAAFLAPHIVTKIRSLPHYLAAWAAYNKMIGASRQRLSFLDSYPCLADRFRETPFDPHYFYQAAWLARRLQDSRPTLHVDVGSSVMMVNVLTASLKMVFVDYRPLRVQLSNLCSIAGNVLQLPFRDESIKSLSCLHVIEHIGLGRYGDSLNPDGSQAAAAELLRVLRPGGRLFLSVPVGRERVCFNAHRVFEPETVQSFIHGLRLESFSLVDDAGRFNECIPISSMAELEYGCGLFEFVKGRA